MKLLRKFGALLAPALAIFFTTQFLAAQTGPTVFTPQLTISPGFLRVVTGPTTVQDLTILGTCSGCGTGAVVANPTGTIGLTPVNGVLASALRSDGAPALSQAIIPTWTGAHTFTANPTTISNTSPALVWTETDAGLDQTNWLFRASSNGLDLCTATDASPGSCTTTIFRATRTGTTPTAFTFGTAIPAFNGGTSGVSSPFTADSTFLVTNLNADLLDGLSSADFAQLAQSNTFTGVVQSIVAATPTLRLNDSAAGTDEKIWTQQVSTGSWRLITRTDANGVGATAIQLNRTGTAVNSIALTSTALTWNGNPISTAVGANPSASLGLTAVNGSAATFMRSDGAPALSQSIAPTWTGAHIFQSAVTEHENAAPIIQIDETDAAANERNWLFRSNAGALTVSTATDAAPTTPVANPIIIDRTGTTVDSVAVTSTTFTFNTLPVVTEEQGTFVASFATACTTTPTVTFDYTKHNNVVTLEIDATSGFPCTGDSTQFVSGSIPANLQPSDGSGVASSVMSGCINNAIATLCSMTVLSSGVGGQLAFSLCALTGCNASGWTAAGNRNAPALGSQFTYMLGEP